MDGLPILAPRESTKRRSQLILHWRAHLLTLDPITGQTDTFTATASGTAVDVNGTTWTAKHSIPRWTWDSGDEECALRMTSRDQFYWAMNVLPQEMTVYVKFVEQGTRTTADARLFHLGHQTAVATDARFYVDSTGTQYRVVHDNSSAERTATVTGSPTAGQSVEILAQLEADGGVAIEMSIEGATATTASDGTANTLAAAWAGPYLHLNGVAAGNQGANDFRVVKIASGTRTLAQMRAAY